MASVTDRKRSPKGAGQRGPAEHERRAQIIRAADKHFRQVGYRRTSVADLARAIGFSPAYIYKFFDSKRAIGEAICAVTLAEIDSALQAIAEGPGSAEWRLGQVFKALAEEGRNLFFNERQLHDIVVVALEERWSAIDHHLEALTQIIRHVVLDGRAAGEFERKTPIDEVCLAILKTMATFANPILLKLELDRLEANAGAVARLVLRSLSP
ncbi:MAG: TetR/AcrR family transcriptional regulator [Gammaproteobacteria bacterium]